MATNSEVILVHGLWYGNWAMASLARRLRRVGYTCRLFSYRSTATGLGNQAAELGQFVQHSPATRVNFVGHSLGGLVILRMLSGGFARPPGRVVLLGTPLQGSKVVRKALRLPGGAAFFGLAAVSLGRGLPDLVEGGEIGMIAGARALGLGRLLGQSAQSGDGTVALAEANARYLSDRIVLPVSHTGLLYSAEVARAVCNFLESGHFRQGPGPSEPGRSPNHS